MIPGCKTVGKFFPVANPNLAYDFTKGYMPDGLSFSRASVAYYYNSAGDLVQAAVGEARIDYNPATLAPAGLLVEAAATYLAMRSTEMDNASYWAPGNITVTPDAAIGIDGEMSMFKIEATATAAGTILTRAHAATAAQEYYTIRAKKGTGATVGNSFGVYNATTATNLSFFAINYDTGVVTHSVGSGATATPVGHDGIWEIRVPVTSGVTALDSLIFYACFTGSAATAGDHAYVGFPDVADNPAVSHMPTADSDVVRSADNCQVEATIFASNWNPYIGTLAVRGNYNGGSALLPNTRAVVAITRAGGVGLIAYNGNGNTHSQYCDIGATPYGEGSTPTAEAVGVAMTFDGNGKTFACSAGGAVNTLEPGQSVSSAATALSIGAIGSTTTAHLTGHVTGVRYWRHDCGPSMVVYLSSENYWNQS